MTSRTAREDRSFVYKFAGEEQKKREAVRGRRGVGRI